MARKATGNYNNQLGGSEYNRQITNMYNSEEVMPEDFYINKYLKAGIDKSYAEKFGKTEAHDALYNGTQGAYNSGTNQLHTYYSEDQPSTRLHEHTHSLNATPQENLIKTQIPLNDNYYDDPSEVYSRLMQTRNRLNLDPRKNYSLDEIEQLKKIYSKDDKKFLNRYTTKQLHFLFNRVAQNNQQLPNNFLNNNIT